MDSSIFAIKASSQLLDSRIEVFVLTHHAKQPTTPTMLATLGIPFTEYKNPDWEFPLDHPELKTDRTRRPQVRDYALRQYRAFRGHQEILQLASPDKFTIVFEDDAGIFDHTHTAAVLHHLNGVPHLLRHYDAVSFHGRNLSPFSRTLSWRDRSYGELQQKLLIGVKDWGHLFFLQPAIKNYAGKYCSHMFKWHEGCLSYAVNQSGREKWLSAGHGFGMPCDLFLVNELNTIVMCEALFSHNQVNGSIISGTSRQ